MHCCGSNKGRDSRSPVIHRPPCSTPSNLARALLQSPLYTPCRYSFECCDERGRGVEAKHILSADVKAFCVRFYFKKNQGMVQVIPSRCGCIRVLEWAFIPESFSSSTFRKFACLSADPLQSKHVVDMQTKKQKLERRGIRVISGHCTYRKTYKFVASAFQQNSIKHFAK